MAVAETLIPSLSSSPLMRRSPQSGICGASHIPRYVEPEIMWSSATPYRCLPQDGAMSAAGSGTRLHITFRTQRFWSHWMMSCLPHAPGTLTLRDLNGGEH